MMTKDETSDLRSLILMLVKCEKESQIAEYAVATARHKLEQFVWDQEKQEPKS